MMLQQSNYFFDRFHKLILILVVLFSFFIRIDHINDFDLWFDELGTNLFSSQYLDGLSTITDETPAALFLHNLRNDPNSSFYYLTVYGYSLVFGHERNLRFLSVFFSLLSLVFFYKCAREFFDKETSLVAVFLLAINPVHLWYAQEARVYAMVVFFSIVTTYAFLLSIRTNKNFHWILFTVLSLCTLFLSYLFVMLLAVFFLGLIIFYLSSPRDWKALFQSEIFLKAVLSFLFIVCAFFLIASPFVSGQLSYVKKSFWLQPPTIETLFHTVKVFTFGYVEISFKYWIGLGLCLFLSAFGLLNYFEERKDFALFLTLCLLFPLIMVFIVSHVFAPIYINRQLLFVSPFYYLAMAKGISGIKKDWIRNVFILFLSVIFGFSILDTYTGQVPYNDFYRLDGVFTRKEYGRLFDTFQEQFRPGDLVVATGIFSANLILSEMVKNDSGKPYDPKQNFRVFFTPGTFDPTERRYIGVDDDLMDISSSDKTQIFSADFLYCPGTSLERVRIEDLERSRIWVISGSFGMHNPVVWNSFEIVNALEKFYVEILSVEQGAVSFKLFERRKD